MSIRLSPASRAVLMAAFAVLAALCAPQAQAQQVILRLHHFLPPTSSSHLKLIVPWCDKIAKDSGDKMKCQIYPAMQLGGAPAQLFDQARDGVVDIVWTAPTYAAGRFTKSEVFELPWMTSNAKGGSQALWDYVEAHASDEYKGVKRLFMHVHDGVVLHFASKQPKTLADMRGLKIRAATRANSRLIAALGGAPVQMPLPQTAEAISKGVVDGASAPWEGAPAIRLAEITKYHLDVPQGAPRMSNLVFAMAMNAAKYESLPADLKKVIDDNSGLAASGWAGEVAYDQVSPIYKAQAAAAGGIFYDLPQAEYELWIKAAEPVAAEWEREVLAKGADGRKLREDAIALIKRYGG